MKRTLRECQAGASASPWFKGQEGTFRATKRNKNFKPTPWKRSDADAYAKIVQEEPVVTEHRLQPHDIYDWG